MKKLLPFILIIPLSLQIFSCSKDETGQQEILAGINDYNLTLNEFQSKLAAEMEMERDFKLTREAREIFLEDIIRKELLIQEAKKMNLDKEERFIRTIERYWESTLIRDLMEKKGKEISRTIVISQDEIKEYYDSMKKGGEDLPSLETMEQSIEAELKEKKKTRKLKEWINGLRKTARIDINQELLYKD